MATDEGTLDVIRQALADSDRVDEQLVELSADGDAVVLTGRVASNEEATVAAMVASQHAEEVRNELRVDPNLREDATGAGGLQRSDPRGFQPDRPDGDLVTDAHEALGENVPLDPPDEPHLAPTEREQRG